jgi:UDP-N-acetylmuramyl tripeptide synthase
MKTASAKTIILLGAEGGGRDKAKRPIMGELSAKLADYVVVSNVDPYEDDPKEILEDIAASAEKHGKVRNKDLFVVEDRTNGIRQALTLAKKRRYRLNYRQRRRAINCYWRQRITLGRPHCRPRTTATAIRED